jgi:uncharacterized membrane protein
MPRKSVIDSISQTRMPIRLARLHARLALSILVGALVLLAASFTGWRSQTRVLAGWDAGVGCYLLLAFRMMAYTEVDDIRRRAAIQDEGAIALLLLCSAAAIASLIAVVTELASADAGKSYGWFQFALGMGTILLSWTFMHTIFALHYAHEYYGERRDAQNGGLEFPGKHPPDYRDFLYFSLVIAMTSQVSDVAITSRVIRRVVNMQAVMAFFFNLTILALTVSMVSNLIRP